jgi:AcrR family transcriptional regulator
MTDMDKKAARQARKLENARAEIKAAAWAQVSEKGAASLSLRAVASAIGLSAPALYRYFPSRDDLVTALIIDAYESLARVQDATFYALEGKPWDEILRSLGNAYRSWALGQPAAFYMIFGAPIPGYSQPTEATTPAAGSSLSSLIKTLAMAKDAGKLALPLGALAAPGLKAAFAAWSDAVHLADPEILYLAFSISSRVQGLTLAELGGQFAPYLKDFSPIFEKELSRIIEEIKAKA